MRKFHLLTTFFSLIAVLASVLFILTPKAQAICADATGNINLGNCLTLGNGSTLVSQAYSTPADLVNVITRNIFIVSGFVLLAMIIYAGFLFISQGVKGAEQAKTVAENAILGFVIMFAAYWILRLIAIITGANILF